jgi:hypothetical protein
MPCDSARGLQLATEFENLAGMRWLHLFEQIRALAPAVIAAFALSPILPAPSRAGDWKLTITPYAWGSLPRKSSPGP